MSKNKLEKILFIPDSHIPYHDKDAFNLMLKAGKIFKPDHVIILGDFADFYAVSSHSKNPNRVNKLKEEIESVKEALDQVKTLGAKNNYFVSGNHEDRLERYLRDRAPEFYNIISIPKILELKEKGFKYTAYKQACKIGKLNITHDTGVAGRYAHYKALDTFQHNIIIGHTHRIGYAVEGDAQGNRHITAMFGWLGDVEEIDYMNQVKAKKEWSLGFGTGYLDTSTGVVYLVPNPIINNTVLVEGKIVTL
jgi:predicted phosphodiesterase